MDKAEFTLTLEFSQEAPLTSEDRRLLLGASLRVLGHRFTSGRPIFRDDVIRVASLADDAEVHP